MRLACSHASRCVLAGPRCCLLALRRVRPLRCSVRASAPPGTLGVPPLPFPAGPRSRFEVVCHRPRAWSSSVTPSVWVRPFAAGVAATMASAGSSRFAVAMGVQSLACRFPVRCGPLRGLSRNLCLLFPPVRPPGVRHIPFASCARRIYVRRFRAAIGFRLVRQPHPLRPPYAVRVPRAEVSPPASFGFRLATDTLAIGYALPAAGRAGDFHPLGVCHARHTEMGPRGSFPFGPFSRTCHCAGFSSRSITSGHSSRGTPNVPRASSAVQLSFFIRPRTQATSRLRLPSSNASS